MNWLGNIIFSIGFGMLIWLGIRMLRSGYGGYEERYIKSTEQDVDPFEVYMSRQDMMRISFLTCAVFSFMGLLLGMVMNFLALLFFMLLLGVVGFFLPRVVLLFLVYKRRRRFLEQLPDALDVLSKAVRAGLSVMQGMDLVARELPPPVSQEFCLIVKDIQLGKTLSQAMQLLAKRMPLKDVRLVTMAVCLSRRVGGDLSQALEGVTKTIRNRFNIEKKVKAMSSESRMQGVVLCLMPFVMFALLTFMNPSMMRPLTSSMMGVYILIAVVILEIVGGLVMWRCTKIKY